MVDTETAERHPELTDGQRANELEIDFAALERRPKASADWYANVARFGEVG